MDESGRVRDVSEVEGEGVDPRPPSPTEKEVEESDDENKMDVDGETPKKRKHAEAATEEKNGRRVGGGCRRKWEGLRWVVVLYMAA